MNKNAVDKIICRTPTKGRDGTTTIPTWKYKSVRQAIIESIEQSETGSIAFKDLAQAVKTKLTPDQLSALGSVGWHVTTVKLNMEVEGEISRVPDLSPQRLVKGNVKRAKT